MSNNKLDRLAEIQAQRETVRMDHDAKINELLAPLAAQLAQLNAARDEDLGSFDDAIAELTTEVKADVLAHGETVKGERLMAVWVKGRTSWDSKRLDGYAAAHPEIESFKTVGEPSVTIRAIGK